MSKNYEPTYEGQLDKCQDERHSLQMQLEEYQEALEFVRKEFHEALDDIAKMKAERDEARREVCDMEGETAGGALLEARKRGWDCFKEPYCFRVNGVVIAKGKAVPPKFELGEDDE